jgi:uncharacterized protein (UPF0264 family)
MNSRLIEQLGRLSDRAARYLEEVPTWSAPVLEAEVQRRRDENDVIAATIAIKRARIEKTPFTALEQDVLQCAEGHVQRGIQPPALFKPITGFGRRPHQTLLSLADGGKGHLEVLLKDSDLLDGVVIHHEIIDRAKPDGSHDSTIAPYRMIDINQNGIIRLHAADDVPVTVYYGRLNYQIPARYEASAEAWDRPKAYAADPLTPSHDAAAAASAAFANGVADVKFSLDGLTVSQAIEFMACVKRSVDRRNEQLLSTQVNLNCQLLDDRLERQGSPVIVDNRAEVARLAVEMTRSGGWERVTLDSASRESRSSPLVDLLSFEELVGWVHEAHAAGIETYISGGMRDDQHVILATHAGVDGVGLGRWIHVCESDSGPLGPIDRERVRHVIQVRNKAEASAAGLAARLLARLDAEYALAGHPVASWARLREDLLQAVTCREGDEALAPLIKEGRKLGFLDVGR